MSTGLLAVNPLASTPRPTRKRAVPRHWSPEEVPPALAEVLSREADGALRLRILPGRPDSHDEFHTRRVPTQT